MCVAAGSGVFNGSLSARRAWIEIAHFARQIHKVGVALRKESVDRNQRPTKSHQIMPPSLSARRAWIEIALVETALRAVYRRSPQGERG